MKMKTLTNNYHVTQISHKISTSSSSSSSTSSSPTSSDTETINNSILTLQERFSNSECAQSNLLLLSHQQTDLESTDKPFKSTSNSWDILCKIINCKVAFKKQFNGKKYNWIQLAGHVGRFKPGDREGFILKHMDDLERRCLQALKSDSLACFVPSIDKILFDQEDNKYFTEMQDLLYGFHNPSIMDIKIGVRTFLECDSDEKETKPRNDLYLKLIEMAPDEPTPQEHELKAITKRRYMSWRERSTCSATLGFRIEAIKKNQVKEREFYSVKEREEVQAHFKKYTDNKKHIMQKYLDRLIDLKESLIKSNFFYAHEMIGSSLLFVHDEKNASIWMIDFGKTRPLPNGLVITHAEQWREGNHEDGYLIGIDNLICIFRESISSD